MVNRDELTQAVTLNTLFADQAARSPQRIALRYAGRSFTYSDLQASAARVAAMLRVHGVRTGALVAICADRSPEYITALLAVTMAGGVYLPIDPALPTQRIQLILEDARPAVIFAAPTAAMHFTHSAARVIILNADTGRDFEPSPDLPAHSSMDDLAYVMYTSGSTGAPKAACIAQRGILRLVHKAGYATFGPQTRFLQNSPLSFDASTFEIWGSLLNGGTCVLMQHKRPSLAELEEVLVSEDITTIFVTTALFVELVEKRPRALRQVHEVLTGGEPIPPASVKHALDANPGLHVIACYGPTECTTFASTHRYTCAAEVSDFIGLGEPIEQNSFYLFDETLRPVPSDVEGELFIGGQGVATGYLNHPELTAKAFLRHPSNYSLTIYRTGDRCVRTKDGELLFKGRTDRQVKVRGFRIELGEIETALQDHPAVQTACVKTETTATGDKIVLAYVVPTEAAVAPDVIKDEHRFATRTREWEQIYSKLLYKSLASSNIARTDPTFNHSGWTSTFDGRPISDAEMEEHVSETVKRILSLAPRNVLEIGCGTGMLLFRLAPLCQTYVGTDFSQAAIDYVQRYIPSVAGADNVTLLKGFAHELPQAPPEGFDLIIINSVSEHFVSLDYLDRLLYQLAPLVGPGGHIFVGDNRNHTLLPLFHAAVQQARVPASTSISALSILAENAMADESQLTIDPYYFAQLDRSIFGQITVQLRRGVHHNELTGYRYDAVLRVDPRREPAPTARVKTWRPREDSLAMFGNELAKEDAPNLYIAGIPNARLAGAQLLLDALSGNSEFHTVGELRRKMEAAPEGEDPEHFWLLGGRTQHDVQVIPLRGSKNGQFTVVCRQCPESAFDVREIAGALASTGFGELANDPLLVCRKDEIAANLRCYLESRLPEHAVPSFIVMLPRLPLTVNGKVDYAALPLPARLSGFHTAATVAEGTALERNIRAVWEHVLGIRNISLHEHFFEIGGDSLKAVRAAEELQRSLGKDISPALFFEAPTISALAQRLASYLNWETPTATVSTAATRRKAAVQRRAALVG